MSAILSSLIQIEVREDGTNIRFDVRLIERSIDVFLRWLRSGRRGDDGCVSFRLMVSLSLAGKVKEEAAKTGSATSPGCVGNQRSATARMTKSS